MPPFQRVHGAVPPSFTPVPASLPEDNPAVLFRLAHPIVAIRKSIVLQSDERTN